MAIPAGHIITVGGLNVIDRLQDVGLQNPRIPTEVVREVGNDLVVGKVYQEADFQFGLTSWDVGCDLMAFLTGKPKTKAEIEAAVAGELGPEGSPAGGDATGTKYKWEDCQFVNLACPWAKDTGSEGGHITSGVLIPAYYPTALAYKLGIAQNAEMSVTLAGGSYYQADAPDPAAVGCYPLEEFAATTKAEVAGAFSVTTSEVALVTRIGGAGSTRYQHVFGVLVDGVIQQNGVDYEETEGAAPGAEAKKVKLTFLNALREGAIIRLLYFSGKTGHAIGQAVHADTTVTPAAVRGRNIEVWLGPLPEDVPDGSAEEGDELLVRGVQTLDLNATTTGTVQREMGTYDPIGFNVTGTDTNGSITIDPKEEASLYKTLEAVTGVSRSEVMGYLNEHNVPMKVKIFDPKAPATVIKSIRVGDCKFQIPGETARVNQTVALQMTFESEQGTFEEVKGE